MPRNDPFLSWLNLLDSGADRQDRMRVARLSGERSDGCLHPTTPRHATPVHAQRAPGTRSCRRERGNGRATGPVAGLVRRMRLRSAHAIRERCEATGFPAAPLHDGILPRKVTWPSPAPTSLREAGYQQCCAVGRTCRPLPERARRGPRARRRCRAWSH